MPFVVFLLILAGAASIFVLYPHMRILAGAVFVLFGAVLGYLIFDQSSQVAREKDLLVIGDVVISEVDMRQGNRFRTISGRVTNGGERANLRSFDLQVHLLDCDTEETPPEDCAIIGEDRGIARVDVPAGQTRAFEATLSFAGVPAPNGVEKWTYEISDVRATLPISAR